MANRAIQQNRRIAKSLGITTHGLALLAMFKAGKSPGGVGVPPLVRDGLVAEGGQAITTAGLALLARAREMGW